MKLISKAAFKKVLILPRPYPRLGSENPLDYIYIRFNNNYNYHNAIHLINVLYVFIGCIPDIYLIF